MALRWQHVAKLSLTKNHFAFANDDVIQREPFSCYWPFVWDICMSPMNFSHNGQLRGALMPSLICAWTNDWANNRDPGDLRRNRTHYDVSLMHGVSSIVLYCAISNIDCLCSTSESDSINSTGLIGWLQIKTVVWREIAITHDITA